MIIHKYSEMYGRGMNDAGEFQFFGRGTLTPESVQKKLHLLISGHREFSSSLLSSLSYDVHNISTNDGNHILAPVTDIFHVIITSSSTLIETPAQQSHILWYDIQDHAEVIIETNDCSSRIRIITCNNSSKVIVKNNGTSSDTLIFLNDKHAEAKIFSRGIIHKKFSSVERIFFKAPNTRGVIDTKYIVRDTEMHYRPLLCFAEGSIDAEGYQLADILKTSQKSRINIVPEIIAHHKNIQSSHGVSIHPVTQEHLEYLQAKGISYIEAKKLVEDIHLL